MARSVGVTCGIATRLMLNGRYPALCKAGVLAPYSEEICEPIRNLVRREGIDMVEAVVV